MSIIIYICLTVSSPFFVGAPPIYLVEFMLMEKDILTIAELQQYLSCSRAWIYVLMKEHGLAHIKLGGRVYFRKKDVDKLLESKLMK